jgi:hypothetical protein
MSFDDIARNMERRQPSTRRPDQDLVRSFQDSAGPDGSELGPTPSDVNRRLHRDMVRAARKRDLLFGSLSIMLGVALGLIVIGSDARIRTQVFIVFFVGYGVMRLGRGVIGDWAVER